MPNIILVGFAGSGKTTIGRRVAVLLGKDFYDTDAYIQLCEHMPAAQVLKTKGERYFIGAQRFAVLNLCDKPNALIATGSSTLHDPKNKQLLKQHGILVRLLCSPEMILANTKKSDPQKRQMIGTTVEEIAHNLAAAEADFSDTDLTISLDNNRDMDVTAEQIAKKIIQYTGGIKNERGLSVL